MGAPSLNYRFYSGLAGLEAIHAPWLDLTQRLGPRASLPHVPFWYRCQLRCFAGCKSLGFSTAWDGERLLAVLPLIPLSQRARGFSVLRFAKLELPNHPYNVFRDGTIDPAAASRISLSRLAGAAGKVLGGGGLLLLGRLREDATLLDLPELRRHLGAPGAQFQHLALSENLRPDDLLSRQSRANLNNARNRMRRLGLQWRHAPDDLPLQQAIEMFVELEASGWKGESGTNSAARGFPDRVAFFHELAAGGDGLRVTVHMMFAGAAPVAAIYGITVGATHLLLLMAYDERFARASPGNVLLHHVIDWARAAQLHEFDFLSTASHFQLWHPSHRAMYTLTTGDGSLNGRLLQSAIRHTRRLRNGLRGR